MKTVYNLLILLTIGLTSFAQWVDYTLRYSIAQSRYEVYAGGKLLQVSTTPVSSTASPTAGSYQAYALT